MSGNMHRYMLASVNRVCCHIADSADPNTFADPDRLVRFWNDIPAVRAACQEVAEIGADHGVPEEIIAVAARIIDPGSSCYLDDIAVSGAVESVLS